MVIHSGQSYPLSCGSVNVILRVARGIGCDAEAVYGVAACSGRVASAVAVPELLYTTKNYIALYYKTYEMLAVLTLMCVLIFLPLSLALRVVERRLQHGQFGH